MMNLSKYIRKTVNVTKICNYRHVSILSNFSKVYDKNLFSQLYNYFENILFPNQCIFREGYSTQHCLLVMIEKFKEVIDRGDKFDALLTDLSKVFDYINHPILIAKIDSYGNSTIIIFSYLSNSTQRAEIKNNFSKRSNIAHGVQQRSILGPLLFKIDLADLFYECKESDIASYAHDTTPYSCGSDTQQ